MNVLLVKTWRLNIGNEVIENGARALIQKALPESSIYEFGAYQYHVGYSRFRYSISYVLRSKLGLENHTPEEWHATFKNPVELLDGKFIDVAILPGCILDRYSLPRLYPILTQLKKKKIPIILLGVGGNDYSPYTVKYVKTLLSKIKPLAVVTRDEVAYNEYSDIEGVKYAVNEIDCGFFISDWYQPPPSSNKFVLLIFDKMVSKARELSDSFPEDLEVIHLTHRPFNYVYYTIHADTFARPFIEFSRKILARRGLLGSDLSIFKRRPIFMSDTIKDYLFLLSNALEIHSDRVHAVVAASSYGTDSYFYFNTPRALLFENAGVYFADNKAIVDYSLLSKKKKSMVRVLQDIVSDLGY